MGFQLALPGTEAPPDWAPAPRPPPPPRPRKWALGVRPLPTWSRLEAEWRAHAASDLFAERLERAKEIARAGAAKGRLVASMSGGKDSSALAGVLVEAGVSAHYAYAQSAFDYPDTAETVDALGKALGVAVARLVPRQLDVHLGKICKHYGVRKPRLRRGREVDEWDLLRAIPRKVCAADKEPMRLLVNAFGHANMLVWYEYQHGLVGAYHGVRALESKGRFYNLLKQGELYRHGDDNHWICTPIVHWSGRDVWAFVTSRNLPVHPYYRAAYETGLAGADVGKIRTGGLVYSQIAERGVLAAVAAVYPNYMQRLIDERPEYGRFLGGLSNELRKGQCGRRRPVGGWQERHGYRSGGGGHAGRERGARDRWYARVAGRGRGCGDGADAAGGQRGAHQAG